MGTFNELVIETACPVCGGKGVFEIQYKYGERRQYRYAKGDKLKWGGRRDIGKPDCRKVRVEGVGGPCEKCRTEYIEFDIFLENDIFVDTVGIGTSRDNETAEGFEIIRE